jgi:hypothetical protein
MTVNNNIRTMEFIQLDDWSRPVYRCIETGWLWKDIELGKFENPILYSCGNDIDGEPDCPINNNLIIVFKTKYEEDPHSFEYAMLGRLQSDCEYYLNFGNRSRNALWAKDEKEQIEEMKRLYNIFPDDKKPEYCTWEQILKYEEEMVK